MDDQLDSEAAQITKDMTEELKLWQEEIGAPPGMVIQFDMFMVDNMLHSLIEFLDEEGIIVDRKKFNNFVARRMVTRMQQHRPEAKKAKLQALQAQLAPGPRFDIPRGNHKKH